MPPVSQSSTPAARAERWLVAQTVGTVVLCSWALGGLAPWAPAATLAASCLSIVPLVFVFRARRRVESFQLPASSLEPTAYSDQESAISDRRSAISAPSRAEARCANASPPSPSSPSSRTSSKSPQSPTSSPSPTSPQSSKSSSLQAFLPLFLYTVYIAISLLNPSHTKAPSGDWLPRADWISWLPTTFDREATLLEVMPWLAALLQAGAVAAGLRSPHALRLLGWGLVANGLALALAGAFFWFAGAKEILGEIPTPGSSFFATFIYKNHWAAFALLGAAVAAGLAFSAWDRVGRDRQARDLRLLGFCAVGLIVMTVPLPGSRSGTLLALIMIGMIVVAILRRIRTSRVNHETHERGREGRAQLESSKAGGRAPSRSGPARSGFVSFVFFVVNPSGSNRSPVRTLLGLSLVVLVVGAWVVSLQWPALQLGWKNTKSQWTDYQDHGRHDTRPLSARDTWRMASVRPWFGWGVGSFEAVFPLFQGNYGRDAKGERNITYNAAHCDWVQLPAELGLVGTSILVGATVAAVRVGWRSGDRQVKWSLGGCGLIGLYAIGDFPLQCPAVVLLMAVLLAAAAASGQAITKGRGTGAEVSYSIRPRHGTQSAPSSDAEETEPNTLSALCSLCLRSVSSVAKKISDMRVKFADSGRGQVARVSVV